MAENKQNKTTHICGSSFSGLEEKLTTAYIAGLFLLMPLCCHNAYYDMQRSKTYVFYTFSAIYILAMLALGAIRIFKGKDEENRDFTYDDMLFPLFAMVYIIGTMLSGYVAQGFLAQDNRGQGILAFTVYGALFFPIRRYGKWNKVVEQSALFALAVVSILGILNQLHIDPLGFFENAGAEYQSRYTSTIGNIDFYGAYCVLFFPISYYGLLNSVGKKRTAVYAAISVLALLGTVAARTEGALLGLAVALSTMPLLCEGAAVKRYMLCLPWALLVLGAYQYVVALFGGHSLSTLTRALLLPLPFGVMLAVALGLAFAARNMGDNGLNKLKRIYRILFFGALACAITVFVLANLCFKEYVPQKIAKYLVITPSWGTDRGRIWARGIDMLKSFTPLQWLFGGGSGCIARWDMADRIFDDAVLDTLHNEYLNYMVTSGVVGALLYIGFVVTSIVRGASGKRKTAAIAVCGCIAYACQAFVNIAQIFTTPLFLILLFTLPNTAENQIEPSKKARPIILFFICMLSAVCLFLGWYYSKTLRG